MTISCEQLDTLQQIQQLALSGAQQTGYTFYHDVSTYAWDHTCSTVHARDNDSNEVMCSRVVIRNDGSDAVPGYDDMTGRMTLEQQRDVVTDFIANNRKRIAA